MQGCCSLSVFLVGMNVSTDDFILLLVVCFFSGALGRSGGGELAFVDGVDVSNGVVSTGKGLSVTELNRKSCSSKISVLVD